MGKGDRTTKRGKLFAGTYGKTRPRKKTSTAPKTESAQTKDKK